MALEDVDARKTSGAQLPTTSGPVLALATAPASVVALVVPRAD